MLNCSSLLCISYTGPLMSDLFHPSSFLCRNGGASQREGDPPDRPRPRPSIAGSDREQINRDPTSLHSPSLSCCIWNPQSCYNRIWIYFIIGTRRTALNRPIGRRIFTSLKSYSVNLLIFLPNFLYLHPWIFRSIYDSRYDLVLVSRGPSVHKIVI